MRSTVVFLTFCIIFIGICFAQTEDPEPTEPPEVSYDVRLRWGSLVSPDVYEDPISYAVSVVSEAPPVAHSYALEILDPGNPHYWIAEAPGESVESILVELYIDHISGPWDRFGFYRVQIRQTAGEEVGQWSDLSWWVPVIDLRLNRFIKR